MSNEGSPACQRLPPEICDMIIDHLHDDTETLAWLPAARMHRFERLHLPRRTTRRSALMAVLCASTSTILPYICHLSLEENNLKRGRTYRESSWLDDALPRMRLQELTNLKTLTIGHLSWAALGPRARAALFSVLPRTEHAGKVSELLSSLEALAVSTKEFSERPRGGTTSLPRFPTTCIPSNPTDLVEAHLCIFSPANFRCITTNPPITRLVVHNIRESSVKDIVPILRSCACCSVGVGDCPETWFIEAGGLSHNPSLHSLELIDSCARTVSILEQVTSPRLRAVTLEASANALATLDLGALTALFTFRFITAKLEIIAEDNTVKFLIALRDELFARMQHLREEKRLEFRRSEGLSMDPDTPDVFDWSWVSDYE
ncbi:uncharacterized protein B0H18DRAFT_1010815 [Fomitopsis serialis]|uniref:uncharacterized protein n=1 Tax=Fomitopsis serialis TaxID=139415 RepID=UPI002007D91E|nr:uncharacterized protein B0H18DRAFT_1010815 [Neoantrodia serialis]KAH9924701.1 hypothetical protein B0H18DRAFT_1010815 [Neoantrodia serialis]